MSGKAFIIGVILLKFLIGVFNIRIRNKFLPDARYSIYKSRAKIKRLLTNLLNENKCCRVWFVSCWHHEDKRFVNGYRRDGTWFCDFEIITDFVTHQIKMYQNVPMCLFSEEWKSAENNGYSCIEDTDSYSGPYNSFLHASRSAKSYYALSIYDKQGNVIGALGCDWSVERGFDSLRIENIKRKAAEIKPLLKEKDYAKSLRWRGNGTAAVA